MEELRKFARSIKDGQLEDAKNALRDALIKKVEERKTKLDRETDPKSEEA